MKKIDKIKNDKINEIFKIVVDKEQGNIYLQDESHMHTGEAEAVYFPKNEDQVRILMLDCWEKDIPVTVSGSRTGVVGGAIPRSGVVLCLERLNRLFGVYKDDQVGCWLVCLEPGVLLRHLQSQVETKSFKGMVDPSQLEALINDPSHYLYPPDPTEGTASLGGIVAANSSGARSFLFGPTRKYVQRLKVVLANGDLLDIQRGKYRADSDQRIKVRTSEEAILTFTIPSYKMPAVKNAAGYYSQPGMDLIDLFIGSEGTLGIITYLELMIVPRPKVTFSGLAFFSGQESAFRFVRKIQKERSNTASLLNPVVLEYFDAHSLELLKEKRNEDAQGSLIGNFSDTSQAAIYFEQFCHEEELDEIYALWQKYLEVEGVNMQETWGGFDERDREIIKRFRHALPEILNEVFRERKKQYPQLYKISIDIAVPSKYFEEMVKYYQEKCEDNHLEYVLFGHIGESHLHLNILPRDDKELIVAKDLTIKFAEKAALLKGTISAEHGVGKLKHRLLEILYGRSGIMEMVRIKLLFDAKGLLNRGNIFPEEYLPKIKASFI